MSLLSQLRSLLARTPPGELPQLVCPTAPDFDEHQEPTSCADHTGEDLGPPLGELPGPEIRDLDTDA